MRGLFVVNLVALMFELDDLKGPFQSKWFHDSIFKNSEGKTNQEPLLYLFILYCIYRLFQTDSKLSKAKMEHC